MWFFEYAYRISYLLIYFQNRCRPSFCPPGEVWLRCRCVEFLKNVSGMPVLLALEATPKIENAFSLDDQKMSRFLTALRKALQTIANHTSAKVGALFDHDGKYYLAIAIVHSDPGHGTKTTIKPYMTYLDPSQYFEMKVSKVVFSVKLNPKVKLWIEFDVKNRKNVIKAQQLKNLTLIYTDSGIIDSDARHLGMFQPLSELLYCTQVQLNETEFIEKDGILTINTTQPSFSVSDYNKISPTQVWVCANQYLRKSKTSGSTSTCWSYFVTILCFNIVDLLRSLRWIWQKPADSIHIWLYCLSLSWENKRNMT